MKRKAERNITEFIIILAFIILGVILTGCAKNRTAELEPFQEPEVKISELPKETTTEPPTEPPSTVQEETTTEAQTEPETEPPVSLRVIFDDNESDRCTFKVQTFTEGTSGQSFAGEIERKGFSFKGWSLNDDGSEPIYPMNSSVSDSWLLDMNKRFGNSVILYAVWEGPDYTALTPGDTNEDIAVMQSALSQLGYYSSAIDGSYGPGTQKAVSAFREDYGLSADGTADAEMLALLYQLFPQEPED